MDVLLMTLLMLVGLFMMLVVLIQRGRGGGLAGAFGGAGGSSAFGTKAGDVFTKITVVVAIIWFALAGISGIVLRNRDSKFTGGTAVVEETDDTGSESGDTPPTKAATGTGDAEKVPDSPKAPSLPAPAGDDELKLDLDAEDDTKAGADEAAAGEDPPADPDTGDGDAEKSDAAGDGNEEGSNEAEGSGDGDN